MRTLWVLFGALSCLAADVEPLLSPPTDFGRSVVTAAGASHGNAPLFWLESRCRIADPAANVVRDFYPCGSCKSENTFAATNLFMSPNYDFIPVFSENQTIVFRRSAAFDARYRSVGGELWGKMTPRLRPAKARVLADATAIAAAVAAQLPLIGQVEIRDEESGRTAVLEFPIKTMKMNTESKRWQVDTGPVVLPDLKVAPANWPGSLRLAYVAYTTMDAVEFIIEVPTPVLADGVEVAQVPAFSEIVHRPSRNRVLAIED